jgi:hypothetical protein
MAASTTVFSVTPVIGLALGAEGASTPQVAKLTKVTGNNGHVFIYGLASETIGSITTCIVGAAGSVSSDAGSAGWTANCPLGAAAGEHLWLQRTTLA